MFNVGDDVEAFGNRGTVLELFEDTVKVGFVNEEKVMWFFSDGRHSNWHKQPTLKLIKPAKRRTKKTLYIAVKEEVNKYSRHGGRDASLAFTQREHAENQFHGKNQIVTVEIEVDE